MSWGYDEPPVAVMSRKKAPHTWHLPQRFKDFAKGDLIWVRESKHRDNPEARVVGVGVARSEAQENEDGYFFEVMFGADLCRHLAASPFGLEVETTPMAARKLKDGEATQLASVVFDFAAARLVDEAL
jgi:hypothetical protein